MKYTLENGFIPYIEMMTTRFNDPDVRRKEVIATKNFIIGYLQIKTIADLEKKFNKLTDKQRYDLAKMAVEYGNEMAFGKENEEDLMNYDCLEDLET